MLNLLVLDMTSEDLSEVKVIEQKSSLSAWSLGDYEEELKREDSVCLVAKTGKSDELEIAGFILARVILVWDVNETKRGTTSNLKTENPNFVEINNIAVSDRFRRSRVGSDLVNGLISAVKPLLIGAMWLEVRESNERAQKFYSKLGFSKEYIRKNYYRNPAENAVVMLRRLV